MNTVGQGAAIPKERDLEGVLNTSQLLLDQLTEIEERLGLLSSRLYGPRPQTDENAPEGSAPTPAGIVGHFRDLNAAACRRCKSIQGWIESLESAI